MMMDHDHTFHGLAKWAHHLMCKMGALTAMDPGYKHRDMLVRHIAESLMALGDSLEKKQVADPDRLNDLRVIQGRVKNMTASLHKLAGGARSRSRSHSHSHSHSQGMGMGMGHAPVAATQQTPSSAPPSRSRSRSGSKSAGASPPPPPL